MIVFNTNNQSKWSGRGFILNKNLIVVNKNGNLKHKINLQSGTFIIKIFAKNRVGNCPLIYKIIDERGKILNSNKVNLSKNWSEEAFKFDIDKPHGALYLVICRDSNAFGSVEIARISIEKNDKHIIASSKKSKTNKENLISLKIKKKIGFVIPYAIFGGAEVFIQSLINNLDTELFEIHLIYLQNNPLKYCVNNVIHHDINSNQNLFNCLKQQKLDYLVYYNSIQAYRSIIESTSALIKKPKLIEIYHSDFTWSDSLSSLQERQGVSIAFKVSPRLLQGINGIERQVYLPVPIDTDKFSPREKNSLEAQLNLPHEGKVIGTVARLSPEKNINYLLDIAKNCPEFNFVIFGNGPQEQSLRRKINSEGIKNAFLLGFKKDIFRYYNLLDAFILPSTMEGTPISILEAMASGLVVFASNVGEIPTIIEDNKNGFYLSLNLATDCKIIRDNIDNNFVGINAVSYVKEYHQKEKVIEIFTNELLNLDHNFNFKKEQYILPGEYI